MGLCVVTDSSAVVPPSELSALPIRVMSLDIAWADGSLGRGDKPYTEIASRLENEPVPPTTGAPSPAAYQELFEELLADHDGVLVVCPSEELSRTFQSATLGARQLGDARVVVLDSKTAAAGQGLVASEAARTARKGSGLDAVCDRALAVASRVHIWATLSQLRFLKRSGRLPAVAAAGAGALGLQPVVRYAGSSPAPVGVVRSEQRGADRLYRAWERSVQGGGRGRCVVFHSARDDDAETLSSRITARSDAVTAATVEVSASLAAHTGPGLLGLAWFWDN